QGRPRLSGFVPNLLEKLNDRERPAPEPPQPPGIFDLVDIYGSLTPGGISCELTVELRALGSRTLLYWGLVIMWTARKLLVTQQGDCWWLALKALRYATTLIQISIHGLDVELRCRWMEGTLTEDDVLGARPLPGFVGRFGFSEPLPLPAVPGRSTDTDSLDAAALRAALAGLLRR